MAPHLPSQGSILHSNRRCKHVLFRLFPLLAFACMCVRVRVPDALAASKNLSSSRERLCPFTNCYLFKIWRQPQVSFCALFLSPSQGQGAQIREKITWLGNPCPAPYFNQPPQILVKRYKIAIKIHLSAQCYSPLSALSLDRFLVSQVPSFLPPAGDNTTLCPWWRWIRPAPSSPGRHRAATEAGTQVLTRTRQRTAVWMSNAAWRALRMCDLEIV